MNVTSRPRLTKEEFLEWENRQERRHEFDGQKVVAMVGATQAHELIVANILIALRTRLRGGAVPGVRQRHEDRGVRQHPLP